MHKCTKSHPPTLDMTSYHAPMTYLQLLLKLQKIQNLNPAQLEDKVTVCDDPHPEHGEYYQVADILEAELESNDILDPGHLYLLMKTYPLS